MSLLPYRLARQAGLAWVPGEGCWNLWLCEGADTDQLQELLSLIHI